MKYDWPMITGIVVERICFKMLKALDYFRTHFLCWLWGVKHGAGTRFVGCPVIRTRHKGDIVMGKSVVIQSRFKSNLVGQTNPCVLETLHGGKIQIGDNSGMTSTVISSKSSVTIGRNVKIGGNVRIFDHDYHSLKAEFRRTSEDQKNIRTKPIIIEDDVFIGTNAIILKGSCIGARSIVAAGSVIIGFSIPPDAMVKGNPAVVMSKVR